MPRKNHPHKYIRRDVGNGKVWACALPDCNHFMPPHLNSLLEGRSAICWGCEEKFTLDSTSLMEGMPRCDDCRGMTPMIEQIEQIESTVNEPVSEVNDRIKSFMKGS